MFYYGDCVDYTCGLGLIGDYAADSGWSNYKITKTHFDKHSGGTPFFVAGFINEEDCKEMYELLEHHAVIAFQSPVLTNKNSGNKFFFCVFSTEPEHEKEKFSWPFGQHLD